MSEKSGQQSHMGSMPGRMNRHVTFAHEAPAFKWSSLWKQPVVNELNLKSYTLPIFNLNNQFSINFHLAWLGFFVAFTSWFAFPPLLPEAITADLRLTPAQVANSNIVSLSATLLVRVIAGPFVDKFGPRKVMCALLCIGAIPSGLAGTARNINHLYVLRFFIGILGGTFVPCLAWTTAFFDKNVVGTANAFVGGWGNLGGGATFCIMTGLFQALTRDHGLTNSVAWRSAFAIVPVPLLLGVACITFFLGTDHPVGKWSERHTTNATALAVAKGHDTHLDKDEIKRQQQKAHEKEAGTARVQEADDNLDIPIKSEVDIATNESLTVKSAMKILRNPLTWLPAAAYMTTFGFELAVDSFLVNVLFRLYRAPDFSQLEAGFYTSIFGFLNIVTRPAGGILGDQIYKRFGVPGKKYLTLFCGLAQGLLSIGIGFYIINNTTGTYGATLAQDTGSRPDLATLMALVSLMAIFNEAGNGANFALVPHCNPYSNGVVTGIVGASGNIGGILFALIFRFKGVGLLNLGRPFWICGVIHVGVNILLAFIPVPRW